MKSVCCMAVLISCGMIEMAVSQAAPPALVSLNGPVRTVFDSRKDACDGFDVPDTPARAYRAVDGSLVVFAMHFRNRALRGGDFNALKLDCTIVLDSHGNEDPKAYDDKSWIAATWTQDGKTIQALLHHEYQANTHPGRCRLKAYIECWNNGILAVSSHDGGRSFPRSEPPAVVAAFPFVQETGQGRHRGFFNPSNIVFDKGFFYFFAATTGWNGQGEGACLFRTADVSDPTSWRGYDGKGFSIRYEDPYRSRLSPAACQPISPFPAPVGSVLKHRSSGIWIAVFQAKVDAEDFPASGFYTSISRDLLNWDKPRLLLAGATLYDDLCKSGRELINYPSLLDPKAQGRNFDDVGDRAELFYAVLEIENCKPGERWLVRRDIAIRVRP